MSTQPRYRHGGCQKGRGNVNATAAGLDGFVELRNRKAEAAAADERFLAAQRRYELRLADRIEAESPKLPSEDELTAFERAMERVKAGAGIIEVRPIPRPEPMFTLGGVSEI